jgi:hypothetical protein
MPDKNLVVLRNTMRRPLVFSVAGQTVRLAPGERLEVPGSWLGGAELQLFHSSGLVKTEGGERVEQRERAEPREDEAGDAKDAKGAKKPKAKSHKPEN